MAPKVAQLYTTCKACGRGQAPTYFLCNEKNAGRQVQCRACNAPYPKPTSVDFASVQQHPRSNPLPSQSAKANGRNQIGGNGARGGSGAQESKWQKENTDLRNQIKQLKQQADRNNKEGANQCNGDEGTGPPAKEDTDCDEAIAGLNSSIAAAEKEVTKLREMGEAALATNAQLLVDRLKARKEVLQEQRQAGKSGSAQLQSAEGKVRRAEQQVAKAKATEDEAKQKLKKVQEQHEEAMAATATAQAEQQAAKQALAQLQHDLAAKAQKEHQPPLLPKGNDPKPELEMREEYAKRKLHLLSTFLDTSDVPGADKQQQYLNKYGLEWDKKHAELEANKQEAATPQQSSQTKVVDGESDAAMLEEDIAEDDYYKLAGLDPELQKMVGTRPSAVKRARDEEEPPTEEEQRKFAEDLGNWHISFAAMVAKSELVTQYKADKKARNTTRSKPYG